MYKLFYKNTDRQAVRLQAWPENRQPSMWKYTVCILILSVTWQCFIPHSQTSSKLEHPVCSLNFTRHFSPLILLSPWKTLCLCSKVYTSWHIWITNITPTWHVNKRMKNCSHGASSANICILQTRHLAKLTFVFAAEPLPLRCYHFKTDSRCFESSWKISRWNNWSPWKF